MLFRSANDEERSFVEPSYVSPVCLLVEALSSHSPFLKSLFKHELDLQLRCRS